MGFTSLSLSAAIIEKVERAEGAIRMGIGRFRGDVFAPSTRPSFIGQVGICVIVAKSMEVKSSASLEVLRLLAST